MERVSNREGTYKAGHYDANGDVKSPNIPMLTKQFKKLGICHLDFKGRVLDIGCGNGRVWQLFPFAVIDAIDDAIIPDKRFVRDGITYQKISFNHFTSSEKYELIMMIGSLYLMDNKDSVILKCKSMLQDKGMLVVLDDTKRFYSDSADGRYYDINGICGRVGMKINNSVLVDNIEMKLLSAV